MIFFSSDIFVWSFFVDFFAQYFAVSLEIQVHIAFEPAFYVDNKYTAFGYFEPVFYCLALLHLRLCLSILFIVLLVIIPVLSFPRLLLR